MQKLDTNNSEDQDLVGSDDELLMNHVIQDDHELLYMHSYMSEFMGVDDEQLN